MSLDIGEAFGDGLTRLSSRPGAVLAVVFVVVALASAALSQTLQVEGYEVLLEFLRSSSPSELGISQAEYDRQIETLQTQVRMAKANSPLALDVPLSVAVLGLLAVAVVAETVSIVAVRAFATDDSDAVGLEDVTGGLGLATLQGFVGGIVVWGLIIVGSVLLLLPGIFAAIVFYFFRQEVALEDRNFIEAMAASYRVTSGQRLNVFALGLLVVVVSQLSTVVSLVLAPISSLAATLAAAALGGVLAAFGAAVVTQAYLQLTGSETGDAEPADPADPYDGALGPDDIPE